MNEDRAGPRTRPATLDARPRSRGNTRRRQRASGVSPTGSRNVLLVARDDDFRIRLRYHRRRACPADRRWSETRRASFLAHVVRIRAIAIDEEILDAIRERDERGDRVRLFGRRDADGHGMSRASYRLRCACRPRREWTTDRVRDSIARWPTRRARSKSGPCVISISS